MEFYVHQSFNIESFQKHGNVLHISLAKEVRLIGSEPVAVHQKLEVSLDSARYEDEISEIMYAVQRIAGDLAALWDELSDTMDEDDDV